MHPNSTLRRKGAPAKPKPISTIVLSEIEAARKKALPWRHRNNALATTMARRLILEALRVHGGTFIKKNASHGRGAHFRFPDGSCLDSKVPGPEVVRD